VQAHETEGEKRGAKQKKSRLWKREKKNSRGNQALRKETTEKEGLGKRAYLRQPALCTTVDLE